MLYEYLLKNYKEAEPIFFSDIVIVGNTKSQISLQLKKLCNEKKIEKYENGVYYIPKKSKLKSNASINADMVARYKYIMRKDNVNGFYSGNTFANQIGISTQVPNKVEIVSNNMAAKIREIPIGKRTFVVRKPIVHVTKDNVYVLQLLDLLKNFDSFSDENYDVAHEKISTFIKTNNISKKDIDMYIRQYPVNVFQYYYELRLDDVFAQR